MKFLLFTSFAIGLAICSSTVAAAQEASVSPIQIEKFDFEDAKVGAEPEGWGSKGRDGFAAKTTSKGVKSGNICLKIVSGVEGAAKQPVGALNYSIAPNQCSGKRIRFRASVKPNFKTDGQVTMWLREDLKSGGYGAFENGMDKPIKTGGWQDYEIVADITDDVKKLTVGFLMFGKGEVLVDDIAIEVVDESAEVTASASSGGMPSAVPGLFQIRGAMKVKASPNARRSRVDDVRLLMPLPLVYRSQHPLTYNLSAKPADALKSVRIFEDKPNNFVAEVTLTDVAKLGDVDIQFDSAVLVSPTSFSDVPEKAAIPDTWPEEARPWLSSTWCVNSKHPRIKVMANKIRSETDEVLEVIEKVEKRAKALFESAEGQVENLTAVEALDKRGSCTSCGNLVAALLRASNVPARVLAGYPSWSGPLQTHYIVEAYVPDFGWYPIESTMCRSPWPNQYQINVSIVPTEYESKSLAGYRTGVAGGVPYLSLTEIPDNDGGYITEGTIPEHDYCDHECKFVRELKSDSKGWDKATGWAERRWYQWLASDLKVKNGKVSFGKMTSDIVADTLGDLSKEVGQ